MMYKLANKSVSRLTDGAVIPIDPSNADYVEYLAWQGLGNVPAAADPPSPAQVAEKAAAAQFAVDVAAVRQHTRLQALTVMSPAQVEAWVNANVTNLTQAKEAISTLAVAVAVLARRV